MANCHNLFRKYNTIIRLSDTDREKLKKARNSLRDRMHHGFKKLPEEDRNTHSIDFQSQGSFVMDTIIKPIQSDFDLDDGVYFEGNFPEEQRSTPKIFHSLIIKSIDTNNGIEEVTDKPTCVRVKYKNENKDLGFHIDIPIYYAEHFNNPNLAHTEEGWIESNPVKFIAWFEEKVKSGFKSEYLYESVKYASEYNNWLTDIRKKDTQLRRIVRYLKSWADVKRKEMPCGIIMSILAANNFAENERDDVALTNTLINIKNDLDNNNFTCIRPTPKVGEDMFAKTSYNEKKYFYDELNSFIASAKLAIENPNQKESCAKWKRHLGDRFPFYLAKDEIEGAKQYTTSPIKQDNSRSAINVK